jgi:phosphohistidine phosphatase SixA
MKGQSPRRPKVNTNMTLSRRAWEWLRQTAADRALREGHQPSMSAVVEELVRNEMAKETPHSCTSVLP